MKFQRKVELMTLGSLLLTGIAIAVLGTWQSTKSLKEQDQSNVANSLSIVSQMLNDELGVLQSAAVNLADSNEIVQAIQREDSAILKRLAKSSMDEFKISILTFTNDRGIVLARGHSSEAGDELDSPSLQDALKGKKNCGMETTTTATYALRASAPIMVNGRIIGALTLGNSIDDYRFVDTIKKMLNAECTIFDGDTRVATTIKKADGERAVGTKLNNPIIEQEVLKEGHTYLGENMILGKKHITAYSPLKDPFGKVNGILFLGLNMDKLNALITKQILLACALVIAITILMLLLSSRIIVGIVRPIVDSNLLLKEVAKGNLTLKSNLDSNDEIGEMARSLDTTITHLHANIKDITFIANNNSTNANELSSASETIISNMAGIGKAIEIQRSIITQTSTDINELVSDISRSCDMTKESAVINNEAVDGTSDCMEKMDASIKAMQEIQNSSDQVSKITSVISQIARQTNLLSLNAAIEAARAGRYGRGFAVVADEVRKLAERSSTAASEIETLIKQSQAKTKLGFEAVNSLHSLISDIQDKVRHSADMTQKISVTLEEQVNVGTRTVNDLKSIFTVLKENVDAINKMDDSVKHTNKMIDLMSKSSDDLYSLTRQFTL